MGKSKAYKRPSNEVIIKAMTANLGLMAGTAETLGVCRKTLYNWLKDDTELIQASTFQQEANLDFAESQLRKRMEGFTVEQKSVTSRSSGTETTTKDVYYPPDNTSIIFYLKTKGKHRGYSQSLDINHTVKEEYTPAQLEQKIAEVAKRLEIDYKPDND